MEKLLWHCPSATAFMCDVFVIPQHGQRLGEGEQEESRNGRKNPRERMRSGSGCACSSLPCLPWCELCHLQLLRGSSAHLCLSADSSQSCFASVFEISPGRGRVCLGSGIPCSVQAAGAALGSPLRHPQGQWVCSRGMGPQPSPPSSSHQLLAVLRAPGRISPGASQWEMFRSMSFPSHLGIVAVAGQCPGSQARRVALD